MLPKELQSDKMYKIIKVEEPKEFLGTFRNTRVYKENGFIYIARGGGEGSELIPMFTFYTPIFHNKFSNIEKLKKIKIDLTIPTELKDLDNSFKGLEEYFRKNVDDLDIQKPKTPKFINLGFDLVAGGSNWYMLDSKITKEDWQKVKKYFKYYKESSDDLDLSVSVSNVWVTQNKDEVSELLNIQ